jgi:aldose 1-epimerase
MPVAVGFHPYFKLTDSTREQWTISVGAQKHWILSPQKIPTGETESIERLFTNPKGAALKDYNLDDVFSDLTPDAQGRTHMIVKGNASARRNARSQLAVRSRVGAKSGPQNDPNFIAFDRWPASDAMNLAQKACPEPVDFSWWT